MRTIGNRVGVKASRVQIPPSPPCAAVKTATATYQFARSREGIPGGDCWVLRGRSLRTRSGPEGSSLKWFFLGVAGLPGKIYPVSLLLNRGKQSRRVASDSPFCYNGANTFLDLCKCPKQTQRLKDSGSCRAAVGIQVVASGKWPAGWCCLCCCGGATPLAATP